MSAKSSFKFLKGYNPPSGLKDQNMEITKYDAFISYRHCELDKHVAVTLHRKLEAFRLPRNIIASNGKKKIERVFRDQDELPLSANLSDPINMALENSEYLIVICTPRLPESEWCRREVETFIKLHGREHVLAVLAEGEPEESFPEALTKEAYEVTDPDGTKETRYHYFEPLAADARGKNYKEMDKALNDVVLRLCASIFGLNYDDLKQRHKERQMKRTLSIMSTVAASFMLFSAVCLGLMFKIINQSNMIMEQNNEIRKQNEEIIEQSNQIKTQNDLIQSQYTEAKLSLAKATTSYVDTLMNRGRKLDAIYALKKVMPSSSKDTSYPYSSETERYMFKALELYPERDQYVGIRTFESESPIDVTKMSPERKLLATLDKGKTVHIWDTDTGEDLFSRQINKNYFGDDEHSYIVPDENTILYNYDGSIIKYDFRTDTETVLPDPFNSDTQDTPDPDDQEALFESFMVSKKHDGNLYLFNFNQTFTLFSPSGIEIYDLTDYQCIYAHAYSELDYTSFFKPRIYCVDFSDDGNILYAAYSEPASSEIYMAVCDIESDSISHYKIPLETCNSMVVHEDSVYICGFDYTDKNSLLNHKLISLETKTGKTKWTTKTETQLSYMVLSYNSDYLYVSGSKSVSCFDINNGNTVFSYDTPYNVCNIYRSIQNGVIVYTGDFLVYKTSPEYDTFYPFNYYNVIPDINPEKFSVAGDKLFVSFENTNYVSLYQKKSIEYEPLIECDDSALTNISSNGLFLENYCNYSSGSFSLYSKDSDGPLVSADYSGSLPYCSFVGDGTDAFVLFGSDGVVSYNTKDGKINYDKTDGQTPKFGQYAISYDKNYILSDFSDMNQLYLYSLSTGKTETISKPEIPENEKSNTTVINLDKDNYALLRESGDLEIYKRNNKKPFMTTKQRLTESDSIMVCNNSNVFAILYSDGIVEFYRFGDTVELIKSFRNERHAGGFDQKIVDFCYYPDSHMYILNLTKSAFILNDELEITNVLPFIVGYLPADDCYVCCTYNNGNETICAIPHYSYDELMEESNNILGDYIPPESIIREFGILQ